MVTKGDFNVGDKVKVHVTVKEGDKERVQVFEGNVISKNRGANATFTVRKVSFGIGVERMFPITSPTVTKVEVTGRGMTTRSKLFYLRKLSGKAARLAENREATASTIAAANAAAAPVTETPSKE